MASTPKVYVICDQNCKWEGLTKEQILTAIAQAVEDGKITDVDTGFVRTIRTINDQPLRFFVGSQAEYNGLTDAEKHGLFAVITDDVTKDGIEAAINELNEARTAHEERIAANEENIRAQRDSLIGGGLIPYYAYMLKGAQSVRLTDYISGVNDHMLSPNTKYSFTLTKTQMQNYFSQGTYLVHMQIETVDGYIEAYGVMHIGCPYFPSTIVNYREYVNAGKYSFEMSINTVGNVEFTTPDAVGRMVILLKKVEG